MILTDKLSGTITPFQQQAHFTCGNPKIITKLLTMEIESQQKLTGNNPTPPLKKVRMSGAALDPRLKDSQIIFLGVSTHPVNDPPWPFLNIGDEGNDAAWTMQIFRQQLIYKDCPVFGEINWSPKNGVTVAIKGIEHGTPEQVQRVKKGLELLRTVNRRGRPPGTGYFSTRESFKAIVFPIIQDLRRKGRVPTQQAVCDKLTNHFAQSYQSAGVIGTDFDVHTLRDYAQRFGWAIWHELIKEVEI